MVDQNQNCKCFSFQNECRMNLINSFLGHFSLFGPSDQISCPVCLLSVLTENIFLLTNKKFTFSIKGK